MKFTERPKYLEAYMIHGRDKTPQWDYTHHLIPPITSSVTFRLESVERGAAGFSQYAKLDELPDEPIYIYERLEDPTTGMLEDRLAAMEGGECAVTFATGMAAISGCILSLLKNGDHLISHKSIYGCTYSLFHNWLPRQGIKVDFVDMRHSDWENSINNNTRVIYFETPINPTLELIDIKKVKEIVDRHNKRLGDDEKIRIVVDNTFASPYCQRPIELGADIVVGSITKHIGGFNTAMGGYVVAPASHYNKILLVRKDFGGALHARTAWHHLVYGIPTLAARMRQEMKTAETLARYLLTKKEVREVHYPGLESYPYYDLAKRQMRDHSGEFAPGALVYFVIKGEPKEAQRDAALLMNWLAKNATSYTLAVSLGCIKTLIEHPSSMTHSAIPPHEQLDAGIEPGGVRISVGLEEPSILIEEMDAAFRNVFGS